MSDDDAVRAQLEQRLVQLTKRAGEIEADEVLDASAVHEVREIQQALGRIAAGTYGECTRCGKPIGDARLGAMPHAATCIECAS